MDSDETNKKLNFELLGHQITFNPDENKDGNIISSEEVVKFVKLESKNILEKSPNITQGQLAVLTSLKLAEDLLSLQNDYKDNVRKLKSSALDALKFIEDVTN